MRNLQTSCRALCVGAVLAVAAASGAQAQAWLAIPLPNSSGGVDVPAYINGSNTIAATDFTDDGAELGIIRTSDGTITQFEAIDGRSTLVNGINANGDVAGSVSTDQGPQGFLRKADGTITTFLVGMSSQTVATALNDGGDTVGYYWDANSAQQGFLRKADGSVASIFSPNGFTVTPVAINNKGVVAGNFGNMQSIGFVRGRGGKITTFSVPGARKTQVMGLTNGGVIAGQYHDSNDFVHAFIRQADGTITTFDDPNIPRNGETFVTGINDDGIVVGYYIGTNAAHGYARSPSGAFVTLDAPASFGAAATHIIAVGPNGKMLAVCYDDTNHVHLVRVNAEQTGF